MEELTPTLQMASLLATPVMKHRHWAILNHKVFKPCNMSLEFRGNDIIVFDLSRVGTVASPNLGTLGRMDLSDLVERGLCTFIETFKLVAADALVESAIENS